MRLIMEGNIGTVLGWRRWLPKDLTRSQLPLRLALGWSMILAARRNEAIAWIDEIAADIASGLPDPGGLVGRECLAMRACVHGLADASAASLALARRYMEGPLPNPWINNVVGNCMLFARLMAGRHAEAAAMPWEDLSGDHDAQATATKIYRLCLRGLSCSQRLLFAEARSCYQEASLMAVRDRGANSSLSAIPAVLLADRAYELDRIDEAEQMLRGRLDAINATGFLDCELRAYVLLTRIARRHDDHRLAHELLDQGERIAALEGWPRMQAGLLAERLRLFLDTGDLSAATGCLARLDALADARRDSTEPADAHVRNYRQIASACMDIRSGRLDAAVDTLECLWQRAIEAEGHYFAVRVGTVQAAGMLAGGQVAKAMSRFREVLELAAPAGLIRTIVDGGPEVGALIDSARKALSGQAEDAVVSCYLNRLASAFAVSWKGLLVRPLADFSGASPLTAREGDVLRLISRGHSNKRIAAVLEVSPETVKSHVKNIFVKLGVDNRVQAVNSGRRQGYFE
jgi:LuxR family maltose regulon positive regulatory protein